MARWFNNQPKWLRTLVYDLTGWQVIRMTIKRNHSAGLFNYTTERNVYSWSRAKRIKRERVP
jgi:hypothetical protein